MDIHYLTHQPSAPLGITDTQKKVAIYVCGALGALALGGLLWSQFGSRPLKQNRRRRKSMFGRNGCREQGGPYLFPKDKAYPVPTLGCAKVALAYAAWPNNIDSAPAVIKAMRRTKWGKDPTIRDQMKRLAKKYASEKHAKKPRV